MIGNLHGTRSFNVQPRNFGTTTTLQPPAKRRRARTRAIDQLDDPEIDPHNPRHVMLLFMAALDLFRMIKFCCPDKTRAIVLVDDGMIKDGL